MPGLIWVAMQGIYRRDQGNLLSSDSCAIKEIDDIRSGPFVLPNVQHTRYFHYKHISFNMYNIPVLSTIIILF